MTGTILLYSKEAKKFNRPYVLHVTCINPIIVKYYSRGYSIFNTLLSLYSLTYNMLISVHLNLCVN
jgi:hypothetical protein